MEELNEVLKSVAEALEKRKASIESQEIKTGVRLVPGSGGTQWEVTFTGRIVLDFEKGVYDNLLQ